MLSKNQMVAVRKAIEMTYDSKCKITEHRKLQKPNKSTEFKNMVVLENQPCKLSFSNITSAKNGGTATMVVQYAKVLIAPDIIIKPGSMLTITQNGATTSYIKSGEPALFDTHQEIILELFKGWA